MLDYSCKHLPVFRCSLYDSLQYQQQCKLVFCWFVWVSVSVCSQLGHFVSVGMTTEVQRLAAENLDCLRTLLVNTGLLLSIVIMIGIELSPGCLYNVLFVYLYLPSERSETGGYYVFTFVCLSVCLCARSINVNCSKTVKDTDSVG